MLKKMTLDAISQFSRVPFFTQVGTISADSHVFPASSWQEAEESCLSETWEQTELAAENELSAHLFRFARERYSRWNEIVTSAEELIHPIVADIIDPFWGCFRRSEDVQQIITGQIVLMAIEYEFADVYDHTFFRELADWYRKGHFPCGWHGNFPNGTLIVF